MTKDLIEILTWQRGANTKSEQDFCDLHIATLPGVQKDAYGNYHLLVGGPDPVVLWSCHTDTVTRREGRQNVKWIGKGILGLHNGKAGQCLGADDGGGVWLMLEMIKEQKPGYYVFHRDEEIGGLGSSWLAKNPARFPKSIQIAIAMDRSGTGDVITHQAWSRCCSNEFAVALAGELGGDFKPDDSGVFTDTANYVDLFAECTNLSIGYEGNHGPREILDVTHLLRLRDVLLKLDVAQLPIVRQPGECDYGYGGYGHGGGNFSHPYDDWMGDSYPALNVVKQQKQAGMPYDEMVRQYSGIAARLLEELGVEKSEFRAHVFAFSGQVLDEG